MTNPTNQGGANRSQFLGALCGIGAAVSFGFAAPLSKLLLQTMPPLILAGVLYLGAGLGITLYRRVVPARQEASLQRADWWKLAVVAVSGGVLGPVLMLIGLQRLPAVEASLLLNLEAPLTILLSLCLFGEHLGRQAALGSACILAGSMLLQWQGLGTYGDPIGLACLFGACAAWALDNNLTQRLSLKDPFAIVRIKALSAGCVNLSLGALSAWGSSVVHWNPVHVAWALLLGSLSYGFSVVLDAYALRWLGAAREAAYFATAPFVAAVLSVWLLGDSLRPQDVGAGLLMACGVLCLLYERHAHTHEHQPLQHDHLHVHDAHHQHEHPEGTLVHEPHAHPHRHVPLVHGHAHVSDEHHRHKH